MGDVFMRVRAAMPLPAPCMACHISLITLLSQVYYTIFDVGQQRLGFATAV